MNHTQSKLPDEVRSPLDEYLDAIEQVLAETGISRSERHNICDEVEAQVLEMAWERTGTQPERQDISAIIAELDDPTAYRDRDEITAAAVLPLETTQRRRHPLAMTALLLPVAGLLLIFTPLAPRGESFTYAWFAIIGFLSIVFAGLAARDIRLTPERYSGMGIAITGALFLPVVILVTLFVLQIT
ncbi:MAG: hypothetical protein ACIAZJ_27325 [Gimesia chilikensis]|uniref:hypothetical protein n=1 Tax=Gimesia chilikensis TaxID=2605989 RepID=UPI0037897278